MGNLWWDLKKAGAAYKPKNIPELEVITPEERAKAPRERCQKRVFGRASRLEQV